MNKYVLPICCILLANLAFAQSSKFELKDGNELYKQQNYDAALDKYNQLGTDEVKEIGDAANFNKGNTYFKTEDYENALAAFAKAAESASTKEEKAKSYHNIGNSYFKMQKLEESLAAYKKALMLNPNDEDTRYNYALVKKLLEQQQQQDQKQDQKNEDKKEEENKNEEQNKDQGENKDEQKDDQQKNQQQQQEEEQQQQQNEQQRQQKQMKRENAKSLLDALNQQEKGVQRKVNKAKGEGKKVKIEKDW